MHAGKKDICRENEEVKKLEHTLGSNVGLLIQEIWYER